ncbi:erythrose-4-phosphate dehydrogenase [Moritella marina ATCC 15381]|uniref:Erythrose-4-phosphate dehydrogenase n=1 Tax=Moritella marina ATCC 15381 TaxID=1202962 RepID=A0A5J6WGB1_MORMI|nr:glyceraldehyde 3-phosphate dehydrogenase NAD-binding domain-containing protein [Moritella marina]QFI37029.1 erythrose-4-phosphate dehydrogenase [Moritella marina ATCC 15381]
MTIRVAVNGYGRIGRCVVRALYESNKLHRIKIVAINELAEPEAVCHLTKYDSSHGRFSFPVELQDGFLKIGDDLIALLTNPTLETLSWHEHDVDIVLDCTGRYNSKADAELHIEAGASKVIFSHPADHNVDATIVLGVNDHKLIGNEKIVSAASCTSNCVLPIINTLDEAFGINCGSITTIHAAMNDQPVTDSYNNDLRKTRAASQSIIPINTKLATGIERILPKFLNKFEAISVRVPTINVTAIDLTIAMNQNVTVEDINDSLRRISKTKLRGILDYTEEPLASIDFNHESYSCIIDGTQTRVSGGNLVKILAWCDNEWGFANRLLDIIELLE